MSGIWPNDIRCVALLTFDVDGVSGAINKNPNTARYPSTMSMREYGPSIGVPRILNLLDRYDIKARFFIPGFVAETHEPLLKDEEEEVLDKGTSILERITGDRPRGYRSPSWELTENSLALLAQRNFIYDASMMGNDIPYIVDANGSQMVEIPGHWQLDDDPKYK